MREGRGRWYLAVLDGLRRSERPELDRYIQEAKTEQIIALDAALRRLESQRPRVARVVHLRFYAGLSVDETARTLGVSARTVDLDWAFARAWLYKELVDAANTPARTDE